MTIREFKNLTNALKEKEVYEEGTLLSNITFENQVCDLYHLFDFYVSLSYNVNNKHPVIICSEVYPELLPIVRNIHNGE